MELQWSMGDYIHQPELHEQGQQRGTGAGTGGDWSLLIGGVWSLRPGTELIDMEKKSRSIPKVESIHSKEAAFFL